MSNLPNIVLVHGAWADGSCWSAVIERLQASGYDVTAPQFPESSLANDVARLRQVLDRQQGPTIVAGHSYGGQIMTALGTEAPNVIGLVYIAAFGLDEGESIGGLLGEVSRRRPWLTSTSIRRDTPGYLKRISSATSRLTSTLSPQRSCTPRNSRCRCPPLATSWGSPPGRRCPPGTWWRRTTRPSPPTLSVHSPHVWARPSSRWQPATLRWSHTPMMWWLSSRQP